MTYQRLQILSRSESGLHYVRDRNGEVLRVLTEDELRDFSDPKPCDDCGEQFGCEHFNIAGEPLLAEAEIAAVVPLQWRAFAIEAGISRNDLERLQAIVQTDGEFRATAHPADLRTQELVILLNERA